MPKKQKTSPLEFGKIKIPKGPGTSPYVPQKAGRFIDHSDILKTLAIGITLNTPILMIGESGTGKTAAIRHLAHISNNGLRRVNLNGGTTADELVGRLLLNDKGTYWVDGILTEAMRKGEWLVLDEINVALPEVLFILHSIMDDDGYLVLTEKDDKEIVRKHPDFRIFATCNPPEYAGTKEMNKALLSRFGICINMDFPITSKELEIIEYHLGKPMAESEVAKQLVDMANETRQSKEAGNADYAINTRDILHTLKLTENMNPIQALSFAFANKLESGDSKAIKSLAKLHLPSVKTEGKINKTKIKDISALDIGKEYEFDADMQEAYNRITDAGKTQECESLETEGFGTLINGQSENAIKNDRFIIEGFYYEEGDGVDMQKTDKKGNILGSLISFTKGANKKKKAVLTHNENFGDSIQVLDHLHEITSI